MAWFPQAIGSAVQGICSLAGQTTLWFRDSCNPKLQPTAAPNPGNPTIVWPRCCSPSLISGSSCWEAQIVQTLQVICIWRDGEGSWLERQGCSSAWRRFVRAFWTCCWSVFGFFRGCAWKLGSFPRNGTRDEVGRFAGKHFATWSWVQFDCSMRWSYRHSILVPVPFCPTQHHKSSLIPHSSSFSYSQPINQSQTSKPQCQCCFFPQP